MIDIAKQTIDFFLRSGRKPKLEELNIHNKDLLTQRSSLFVTIYYKGEVRGSAGNIKELEENTVWEIVENTIAAISKDSRFKPIGPKEAAELKIRIDVIIERNLLKNTSIVKIDPTMSGVIVIKTDYSTMAAILPNVNPKLINGQDFIPVLKEKLGEKDFKEQNYIIYEIKTRLETSF